APCPVAAGYARRSVDQHRHPDLAAIPATTCQQRHRTFPDRGLGLYATRGAPIVRIGLIVLLVLVGLNLRPALSSLAPLLARVQAETGLSAAAIGALTTLPVLCLGLFAPLAPWLSRRIGIERTLSLALLLLAAA